MNSEEQRQYNSLSYNDRECYDRIEEEHPSWSHKQIMVKVAFNRKEDEIIERGGNNLDAEDPAIMSEILQGVKRFLYRIGAYMKDILDTLNTFITLLNEGKKITQSLKVFWEWLIN